MLKFLKVLLLSLIPFITPLATLAQNGNTTVSAIVKDPTGALYVSSQVNASFIDPGTSGKLPLINGSTFQTTFSGYGTDSFGFFTMSLPDNGVIGTSSSATGTSWKFTICFKDRQTCFTYQTPIDCLNNIPVACTNNSMDLSTPIQAVAALLPSTGGGGSPAQGPLFTVQASTGAGHFQVTSIIDDTTLHQLSFGDAATFNSTITANNGGALSGVYTGSPIFSLTGNEAIKPATNDSIQYVSANGNDSNDGLSLGSAKLTITAALKALPGGSSTTSGSGTVLANGTVAASPASTCGIWLMGSGDPNFGSPPTCWLKWAPFSGQSLTIGCLAKSTAGPHGHTSTCTVTGGGTTDSVHPSIWISSLAQIINFKDLSLGGFLNTYIKLGITSNNIRTGAGGVSSVRFDNLAWNSGACRAGGGPGADIGSNSFWIYFNDVVGSGCTPQIYTISSGTGAFRASNITTITTTTTNNISNGDLVTIQNSPDDTFNGSFRVSSIVDGTHFTYSNPGPNNSVGTGQVITAQAAAINIDPGPGGSGSGLIFIDRINLNNGGIRFVPGTNGGSMSVHKVSYEGDFSSPDMPPILITSEVDPTLIDISDVQISDPSISIPDVQVDNPSQFGADSVIVSRLDGGVRGRAHILGGTFPPGNQTMLRAGQYGFQNGLLAAGGIDVERRAFSPAIAPGSNLAITSPGSWTYSTGSGTITTGISAPDGTLNAGRITSSSGLSFISLYIANNVAVNVGDFFIFGAWVRSQTGNGYANSTVPIKFVLNNNGFGAGDTCIPGAQPLAVPFNGGVSQADGQWQWYSGICKVNSNPANAGLLFAGSIDTTHTLEIYAPVVLKFTTGTKSDNEAWEIANNLASFSAGVPAGTISMLRGQSFAMSTGANFLYLMGGTPTADRTITWQDASGIVAFKDIVQTFTAKQTFSSAISSTFIDFPVSTTPGNPSAGSIRVYGDSVSGNLTCLTSAGANCNPGGGGGGTPGGSDTQVQINSVGSFIGSVNLTYTSPTLKIGSATNATGILSLAGLTSGVVSIKSQDIAGTYNFNLPTSAGSSGLPLVSGGGGSTPMTFSVLTVPGGGTGGVSFTNNQLVAGGGVGAFQSISGTLVGANPILTLTAGSASAVPLTLNTATSPTGDLLDLQVNGVKTSFFDAAAILHTPQTTYNGSGALTLSGNLGTCPGTISGTAVICLGDSGTLMALLSNNGLTAKPIAQLTNATPAAHGVALASTTAPQLVITGPGLSGQPFLSGGPSADGAFGALNLAGGATIVTGVLPLANINANVVTSNGAITVGHCASFQSSTVIQDSGGACGGSGTNPPLNNIIAMTASNTPINNASFTETLNWTMTGSTTGLKVGEAGAATGAGNILFDVSTLSTSTALVLQFDNNGNGVQMSATGALAPLASGSITSNKINSLLSVNGITTAGVGVPFILGTPSNVTAQSASQGSVTLATAPASSPYRVVYYANQNALCTTGANSVSFTFNWTDAGNARSLTTGNLTLGSSQSTLTGFLSGSFPIYNNSGNVTYTSTVSGACGSGTSSYDIHASIERVQ